MEKKKELSQLTKRQNEILKYIKKYSAEHGFPPAIREICEGVGLSSPATAFVHVKNLQNAGYLKKTTNKFRTIELLVENEYENPQTIEVPFYKSNNLEDFNNNVSVVNLQTALIPDESECVVLKIEEEIENTFNFNKGDYLVIKKENDFKEKDILITVSTEKKIKINNFVPGDIILGVVIGTYKKF